MPSPILLLQGNILEAFENPNGSAVEMLRAAIEEGIFRHELDLSLDETPPVSPIVIRPRGEPAYIQLHVVHLELLWAFVYGWIVLYEEAIQRPWIEGDYDGRILLESELTQRAAELLNWASSLRSGYTHWPDDLPSPRHSHPGPERDYVHKANGIFQQAAAFVLFHEFGHIRQQHLDVVHPRDQAVEALATAIEMEREADDFAFRVLVSANDDEATLRLKGWSILTPALSSLYLLNGRAGVFQRRHPHLHHRIQDLLAKLDFQDEQSRFYYHYLCATVLRVFDRAHDAGAHDRLTPELFETADDALAAEINALDAFLDGNN